MMAQRAEYVQESRSLILLSLAVFNAVQEICSGLIKLIVSQMVVIVKIELNLKCFILREAILSARTIVLKIM